MGKILKWGGIALLVLIVIGAMSSMGSDEAKKVGETTNANSQNAETVSNEQETPTTQTYKIGDLVDLDGKTMAVNAVEPYTSGNQFMVPKDGNKYVTVDITLKNNSKEPYTYNPYEFKLNDSEDYGYDYAITDKEPTLNSGTIQPGQTTRGFLTFEIPEANTASRLVYTPGFWSTSQIIVDLAQ